MKKFFVVLICFIFFCGCEKSSGDKMVIMTSNFPCYDFVRAIVGEDSSFEVKLLVPAGEEIHDFEPTPKDIIEISKSKMFFYVGGESDLWVNKVLENLDGKKTKVIKMIDLVDTMDEEEKEGMESEEEEKSIDEHVWTSPKNAITIIQKLKEEIISLDEEHAKTYEENCLKYLTKLKEVDLEIESIVSHAQRKVMIFGDRFPLLYFASQYGLDYYAAFPGCSSATEASAQTLQFLIQKVKEQKIPVVFHIEFSNQKIAEAIAKETGAKVLEFHSLHNVSSDEFKSGVTYIDLMKRNIKALKEALL